ncbi:MAG: hypothetical protein QHJ73_20085 [Armatimonadota bacterium]|nr:hypothetical protein [Armatimonadota bacterium]
MWSWVVEGALVGYVTVVVCQHLVLAFMAVWHPALLDSRPDLGPAWMALSALLAVEAVARNRRNPGGGHDRSGG